MLLDITTPQQERLLDRLVYAGSLVSTLDDAPLLAELLLASDDELDREIIEAYRAGVAFKAAWAALSPAACARLTTARRKSRLAVVRGVVEAPQP
jgi:hypothetical protein